MKSSPFRIESKPAAVDLESMPRADVPAIWTNFRQRFENIKKTAETLIVTSVDQIAEMRLARDTRLVLKNIRVEVENKRKELGEEALRRTQKINAQAREIKELIEPLEARLLDQEQFAEREHQRLWRERFEKRSALIKPLLLGAVDSNIGSLTDDEFALVLKDHQSAYDARIERERIEKQQQAAAEAERLRTLESQRLQFEKERKQLEEKNASERAAREQAEEAQRQERERRQALEAEQKQTREAAEKAERARKAEEKRLAKASDSVKLKAFAKQIEALVVPDLKVAETHDLIESQRVKFANWVKTL